MKCIIIDDEPLAQEVIEKLAAKVPFLEVIKKAGNAIEGLQDIENLKPDLVFMDIQMPTMSGIELIKILNNHRPQIILTTASPDHALEGFELDVAGYLLKPISFERFLKAVNKVNKLVNGIQPARKQEVEGEPSATHFWAKVNGKLLHIKFDDVLLVKGMKDYVQVFLKDRKIITYLTMKRILEILPPQDFTRVSRSFIVRTSSIKGIDGNVLETTVADEEIIIGSTYRESIKNEANKWLK
ncbi:LytTR family DNA-binding domain-containing protein [Pontibacter sp. HSC-14F20]|uniref:LytR/AlgR family response regulator transcription factor n=1 Tax=Pontibacter sp. HSC-14F20 TaxID=2864136 RepID=UPI001C736B4C|nr:LytTR family DNA-binding domain-containing protein [Pontibacter sp. HSC-14F20]MBX0335341.1 LytTR family DNA-binding domain-containing protein [Pontibacter sp. HSC-14F20]